LYIFIVYFWFSTVAVYMANKVVYKNGIPLHRCIVPHFKPRL